MIAVDFKQSCIEKSDETLEDPLVKKTFYEQCKPKPAHAAKIVSKDMFGAAKTDTMHKRTELQSSRVCHAPE